MEVRRTGKNQLAAEETREEAGGGNQAWVESEQGKDWAGYREQKPKRPKRLRKRQREREEWGVSRGVNPCGPAPGHSGVPGPLPSGGGALASSPAPGPQRPPLGTLDAAR